MHDLFGVSSQTLQRHVLYMTENYNILIKNSIIGTFKEKANEKAKEWNAPWTTGGAWWYYIFSFFYILHGGHYVLFVMLVFLTGWLIVYVCLSTSFPLFLFISQHETLCASCFHTLQYLCILEIRPPNLHFHHNTSLLTQTTLQSWTCSWIGLHCQRLLPQCPHSLGHYCPRWLLDTVVLKQT